MVNDGNDINEILRSLKGFEKKEEIKEEVKEEEIVVSGEDFPIIIGAELVEEVEEIPAVESHDFSEEAETPVIENNVEPNFGHGDHDPLGEQGDTGFGIRVEDNEVIEETLETPKVEKQKRVKKEKVIENVIVPNATYLSVGGDMLSTISFPDWLTANAEGIRGLGKVSRLQVNVEGVDPQDTIMFKTLKTGVAETEAAKKELISVRNAKSIITPNYGLMDMIIFRNNAFIKLIQKIDDDVYIKSFLSPQAIQTFFCIEYNGYLVPYFMFKTRKGKTEIPIVKIDVNSYKESLDSNKYNLEDLQIMYKQSCKFLEKLTSTSSILEWLYSRQAESIDSYHQTQIETVVLNVFQM